MKIGDDRLDNVDLGRSSGTDGLGSGGREFELGPDQLLGVPGPDDSDSI